MSKSIYLLLILTPLAWGSDWSQWRGPQRDGKSGDSNLIRQWPDGGPKLLWRAKGFGAGYSSLAVVEDGIYTLGDVDGSQRIIGANRSDGSVRWTTPIGPEWKDRYGGFTKYSHLCLRQGLRPFVLGGSWPVSRPRMGSYSGAATWLPTSRAKWPGNGTTGNFRNRPWWMGTG